MLGQLGLNKREKCMTVMKSGTRVAVVEWRVSLGTCGAVTDVG